MEQIRYIWTDGSNKDFQRFYLSTEEYYSSLVGGVQNRIGYIPYNISDSICTVLQTREAMIEVVSLYE